MFKNIGNLLQELKLSRVLLNSNFRVHDVVFKLHLRLKILQFYIRIIGDVRDRVY